VSAGAPAQARLSIAAGRRFAYSSHMPKSHIPARENPGAPAQENLVVPSLGGLFIGFFKIGLIGFGGVLPLAQHEVVVERRWQTQAEFTDLLALCQFLPGGNTINYAAALGLGFHGLRGALTAVVGLVAPPVSVVLALGLISAHFQDDPAGQRLFAGLAAAAAGLIISMAVKLAVQLRGSWLNIALAVLCLFATVVLRLPLLDTLAVLGPLSLLLAWRAGA
jgi:chromate transporter